MAGVLDHLGLVRWPFTAVPDPQYSTFIADRRRLSGDLSTLLTSLSRRDVSTIHLFWAWFGAGKTHTMYYLANQAAELSKSANGNALHTIYTEFPRSARGFVDLYRSFAMGLDMDALIDAYLEVCTCRDSERFRTDLMRSSPDLFNALQVLTMGEAESQLRAFRWLRGETLLAAQMRSIGVSQRIGSSEKAVHVLSTLIHMFGHAAHAQGRPGCLVVWMIDEFQRITQTGSRGLGDINTGLHSTFNACPSGLSLLLAFSGRPQKRLPTWFSRELQDRIGTTKVMLLPPMVLEEALVFVKDVLAQFRPAGFNNSSAYFPFSEDTCNFIIREVDKQGEIKPRAIMQAFGAVLEEADPHLESGRIKVITPQFARRALAERVVFEQNEEA